MNQSMNQSMESLDQSANSSFSFGGGLLSPGSEVAGEEDLHPDIEKAIIVLDTSE